MCESENNLLQIYYTFMSTLPNKNLKLIIREI
jgi:hypothetical protein